MVGDRLDADLAGAAAAGLDGAIVLTGVTDRGAGRGGHRPRAGRDRRRPPRAGHRVTLSVIVNPAAGGGRAGRALRRRADRLTELGLEHHVETTRSLDHARELAPGRRRRRRDRGRVRRRRPDRRRRRRAARRRRRARRAARAAAATTSRGCSGSRSTPWPPARCWPTARRARWTSARSTGARSSGSPAAGSTPIANRIANETPARARQPRLRLRRAARAGELAPGRRSRSTLDGGRPHTVTGYTSRRRQLELLRWRDAAWPPTPRSTTACWTW